MDVSSGVMGTQCIWNFENFVEFEMGNERPQGIVHVVLLIVQ